MGSELQYKEERDYIMNKSESIANLSKALAAYMAEINNPKNVSKNPFFGSKYSPLNEVLNVVRPVLAKHGLSVIQNVFGTGDCVSISSILIHESGEYIEMDPLTLKPDKQTPQGIGSAVTYGRRYTVSPLVGVSSEDDDDGNEASKPVRMANVKSITDKQAIDMEKSLEKLGKTPSQVLTYINTKYDTNYSKLVELPQDIYKEIMTELNRAKAS